MGHIKGGGHNPPRVSGFKYTRMDKHQYINRIIKLCEHWNIPKPPNREELEQMSVKQIKLVLREIELRIGKYRFHRKEGCW